MASPQTMGLSIQRSPYSETSQIVHFLTRDWGRIVCLAKGAFRIKNSFRGAIDLMGLHRISITRRKGSSIALLRSCQLLDPCATAHRSLDAYAQACLLAELLRHGVPEHQAIPGLFELTRGAINLIEENGTGVERGAFIFQGVFLRLLGFTPVLDRCVECQTRPEPGRSLLVFPRRGGVVCRRCRENDGEGLQVAWKTARLIEACIDRDFDALAAQALEPGLIRETWAFYAMFLQYYLEKRVKAYAFIEQLAEFKGNGGYKG